MVIAEFMDVQGDAGRWYFSLKEDFCTTLPKGTTQKREQKESKNQTLERRAVKPPACQPPADKVQISSL